MSSVVEARPAGTAVLLCDEDDCLKVLLLKRNPKLAFAGGVWVFPGGAVDKTDYNDTSINTCSLARVAAKREAFEECGLTVSEDTLYHFCKWTTPVEEKKRFCTWFFVGSVTFDNSKIKVDGSEILDYKWLSPLDAILAHRRGSLNLMPPTYMVLSLLTHFPNVASALDNLSNREPYDVCPKMSADSESWLCLYPGDAGYEKGDPNIDGARHRTHYDTKGIQYVHSGADVGFPAMNLP